MFKSGLQTMWRTRSNISTALLFQTRRTFCMGKSNPNTKPFHHPQPQISFFSSSLTHTRSSMQGIKALHPNGTLPASQLQRLFSTSSRSSLRYHVPPRREQPKFLGFLDKIPQNTIFLGIIGLNATVFVMWYMAKEQYRQERDPSAIIWMNQNFTTSWNNLTSGRFWTPLTACFSHQNLSHILFNGFTFFFMARPVLEILGSRQFIFLYLGGGLISSFTSGIWSKVTGKNNYASHGASGAIFSIVTLLACVAPNMKFHLYGILPVPAWLAVSGLFAYDLYSTVSETSGTTDTVGHVGGVVGGILYFIARRLRLF